MRRLKVRRCIFVSQARTLLIVAPLQGQLMLRSGLCCTHGCGHACIWPSLELSSSGRCIYHATSSPCPCTWCVRHLGIPSHPDDSGIPRLQRLHVGVTVCVKPPLCRRSSQCDRSWGPICSSCSRSVVGVCEVSGHIGEEANKGNRDMTRG